MRVRAARASTQGHWTRIPGPGLRWEGVDCEPARRPDADQIVGFAMISDGIPEEVLAADPTLPFNAPKPKSPVPFLNFALLQNAAAEVKAAIARTRFEMLVGFQLTEAQLAYNVTR